MHRSIQNILNRRAVLTGGAVAPLALAVPSAVAAGVPVSQSTDPLPQMVSDWLRCLKVYSEICDLIDAEYDKTGDISHEAESAQDKAYDVVNDKGRAICSTPATTPEGLAFQLAYFVTDFGEEFVEGHGNGFDKIIPSFRAGLENTLKETCGEISR